MKKRIILGLCAISYFSFSQDTPCTATALSVNSGCVNTTGNNTGMTDSGVGAPGCASYNGGDVWFSFTVPAGGEITATGDNNGGFTDGGMAIYSGPNCSSLTLEGCNDDSGPGLHPQLSLTGLTPGATMWIRYWEYGNNSFGPFSICVVDDNPPPPSNDEPCNAIPLSVNAVCAYSNYSNQSATASAGVPAPGCASYSGGDVWFTVNVPASGNINIDTETGVITDGGMAIYSGTCGSLSLIECDDDDSPNGAMAMISLTGQTPGATLWIRIWEYGNNNNGTFGICAQEPPPIGPCGNETTNDWCSDPAILTQGGSSWSSTTSSIYTADNDAGVSSPFCGSIENNSWYAFTANNTTEVFNFTNITNCSSNFGVQAEVFDITADANGCCISNTSVSNCYSTSSQSPGTVTATGLTIGNTYYLMVDGYAGDACDFTVTGWSATGILPIDLKAFSGVTFDEFNLLRWTTASERNNDYFIMERSIDGINFEPFGEKIAGQGTVVKYTDYEGKDNNPLPGTTYYRLKQVDYNGEYTYTDVIALNRDIETIGELRTYPNPFNDGMKLHFNLTEDQTVQIQFFDQLGSIIHRLNLAAKKGGNSFNIDAPFKSGVYMLNVVSENGEMNQTKRVIKQ